MTRRLAQRPLTIPFLPPRPTLASCVSSVLALGMSVACSSTPSAEAPEPTPAEPVDVEPAPLDPQPEKEEPVEEPAPPEPMKAQATKIQEGEKLNLDAKGDEPFWDRAPKITWDTDWAGKPSGVKTTVRIAYAPETALYLFWELDGAEVSNTQKNVPIKQEHTTLWKDDAAEIFLGSPDFHVHQYYEIEVGPLGHYFDLAINHQLPEGDAKRDDIPWSSGLRKKVARDEAAKTVTIEMALESPDIAKLLKPGAVLPMGLYRIEGKGVPDVPDGRHYLAWSPTMSEKPAFHVPEKFGRLELQE